MENQDTAPGYFIWGIDNSAYGPIELPTLVNWIKDQRVLADTWVYVERDGQWCPAKEISELRIFFKPKPAHNGAAAAASEINPAALRRIKALAEMTDGELSLLLGFVEIVQVRPFAHVIQKGVPSDAMYGVLEGELRSFIVVDGKECPVATLGPGSIFGEISLFDKGPHAADVIANLDSTLMKLSASAIGKISKEEPGAAVAMLLGLIRAIAGRVRTLTKRYEDSVHSARFTEHLQEA